MRLRRRMVGLAGLIVLVAGCGTTVSLPRQSAGLSTSGLTGGGSGAGSTNAGTPAAPGSTGGGTGLPTGDGTAGVGPAGAANGGGSAAQSSGTTGGLATEGGSGGAATSGRTAPGAPIKVGFLVLQGGGQVVAALGAGTPVAFGNGQLEAQAVVDAINKSGGINGHPLQPYYAQWDAASKDSGLAAACTQLTEDDHVAAILDVINVSQVFVACAAQHQTILLNASFGAGDDTLYQDYGQYFYSPNLENMDREERLVLDTLKSYGKLANVKVGVAYDATDPQYQRVLQRTVGPLLDSWHVPFESYGIAQQSDVEGAVLKFAADGDKEVVFIAPSGIIELLFMQTAQQQHYFPNYGTGDSVDTWFVGEEAPVSQAEHMFGAGTLPISNVPVESYPTTAREATCLDLMKAAGENDADRHTSLTATLYCELGFEFRAIMDKVSGPLTASSFRAAYNSVGSSYQSITTFAEDLTSARDGGASAYRVMGWSTSCSCMVYMSPVTPMAF